MGKRVANVTTEDFTLQSSDGATNVFVRQYTRGTPTVSFLIVHGAIEHSGRHIDLVNYWMKNYQNVQVTVFDHVGHGRSGGNVAFVDHFKTYVNDFLKVGQFVHDKLDASVKRFICAHSLGGLITLTGFLDADAGWTTPVDGLIFSSPCIKPRQLLGSFTEPLLESFNKILPRFHLPAIYRGSDLTRDQDRGNDFDIDPLIPKFMTVRMGKTIVDAAQKIRGQSYYIKVPCLFLIAGDDRLVDPESTTLFAHGIDKSLVQVVQYPEARHELWNEVNRFEIFDLMKKWVDKKLKERT